MLINIKTLARVDESAFRAKYPSVSFPRELTDNHVRPYGHAVLNFGPQPTVASTQRVVDGGNVEVDGKWQVQWDIVDKTKEELIAENPRVAEIKARLSAMDFESIRPLRAIQAGTDEQADHDKLAALAAEHVELVAELRTLIA